MRAFWDRLPCSSTAGTPARVELAGQRLGAVLGAGEDQRPARRRGEVGEDRRAGRRVLTCSTWWVICATGELAESTLCVTGFVQEALDQDVDAGVEGGREQHPLALASGVLSSSRRTTGQEAEVGHVVGLVEHGDLDRVEVGVAGLRRGRRAGPGRRRRCRRRRAGRRSAGRRRRRRRRSACAATAPWRAGPSRPRSGWRARGSAPGPARGGGRAGAGDVDAARRASIGSTKA